MQIGQAKYTDCHITSCCNNAEALKANTKSFNQQGAAEKIKKVFLCFNKANCIPSSLIHSFFYKKSFIKTKALALVKNLRTI